MRKKETEEDFTSIHLLADLGVEFVKIGACHWERVFYCHTTKVIKHCRQTIALRSLQNCQLVVRLT